MSQVILSSNALRNLDPLLGFVRPKNPVATRRAAQAIKKTLKLLTENPDIGRVIEDMPEDYREVIIDFGKGGYLARYRFAPDEDVIVILAIRHQRELDYNEFKIPKAT